MLTQDNNKTLFKNNKFSKNEKQIKVNNNIVEHGDCILQMESLYKKLQDKEKYNIILDKKHIKLQSIYKSNYDFLKDEYNKLENKFVEVCDRENDLFEENNYLKDEIKILKIQLDELKILADKNNFINDDLMYIDFNIFQYESHYELKEQIDYYERQIDIMNSFFNNNNISNFEELIKIVTFYKNNNDNITSSLSITEYIEPINKKTNIGESKEEYIRPINLMSRKEINQIQQQFDNSFKKIKDKLSRIREGDIITIKGIQRKAMLEEEFNKYYLNQIVWAKNIIGDSYDDKKIIKLLDIYNKLCKTYKSDSSSDDELDLIANEMETVEQQRFYIMCKLGSNFINNNISDKSQISDFIKRNKKILHYYDVGKDDNKVNRFISTCKRLHLLSENINVNNIIKSKCLTNIRDMNNIEFDNILKLLENKNKNQ